MRQPHRLQEVTGWQPHSVRGFLASIRKKLGLALVSTQEERWQVYRITYARRAS